MVPKTAFRFLFLLDEIFSSLAVYFIIMCMLEVDADIYPTHALLQGIQMRLIAAFDI